MKQRETHVFTHSNLEEDLVDEERLVMNGRLTLYKQYETRLQRPSGDPSPSLLPCPPQFLLDSEEVLSLYNVKPRETYLNIRVELV